MVENRRNEKRLYLTMADIADLTDQTRDAVWRDRREQRFSMKSWESVILYVTSKWDRDGAEQFARESCEEGHTE